MKFTTYDEVYNMTKRDIELFAKQEYNIDLKDKPNFEIKVIGDQLSETEGEIVGYVFYRYRKLTTKKSNNLTKENL